MNGCPEADTCRGLPLWVMRQETETAMKGSSAAGCSTWLSDAFMDAGPDVERGYLSSH